MTTTPVYNPWRESLENCIEGSNYLRASEYRALIAELDDLYARREQEIIAASPHPEPVAARRKRTADLALIPWGEAEEAEVRAILRTGTGLACGAEMLHPATADLVKRFADALRDKLAAAEAKYGYSDNWARPGWMDECRTHLRQHIEKGDPRDVAAYCAFLWHHGASTAPTPAPPDGVVDWLDDDPPNPEKDFSRAHPEPESAAPAVSDEVDRRDTLERAWAAFCQKHDAPAHYLIPEDRLKNSLRAALYAALPALTAQVASLVAELRGLEKECRERGSGLTAQQLRAILSRYPEAK